MKILILTGSGALVGAEFYNQLINQLNRDHDIVYDQDFPEIILYNLPLEVNPKGELHNIELLKEKLIQFNKFELDYLFVLCNSISNIVENLKSNLNLNYEFINIINNTKIESIENNNTLILSSNYTNINKLYGVEYKYLNNKDQIILDNIIESILKKENIEYMIKNIDFKLYNINKIILGCTELYYLKDYITNEKINIICSFTEYLKKLIKIIINNKRGIK